MGASNETYANYSRVKNGYFFFNASALEGFAPMQDAWDSGGIAAGILQVPKALMVND